MEKIARYYITGFYTGFLILFAVLYRTNEVIDLYPGKIAAGVYALVAMLALIMVLIRVLQRGYKSRLVCANTVVGSWRRYNLPAGRCRKNAMIHLAVLYGVLLLMALFRELFANYFFVTVMSGYLAVEIIKTRTRELNFWRLHFSPVAFGLLMTFAILLITSLWAK